MTSEGRVMTGWIGAATLARRGRPWEWRVALMAALCFLLAACGSSSKMGDLFTDEPAQQKSGGVPGLPAGGGTKVALLLPLSGQGDTTRIATAMKQAAEMALIDAGNPGITLLTKDTGGSAAGARAAADAALNEGAQLILGPLFAVEVQAVAPVARTKGVSVIAFSSDSTTAGSGTFLMSFLPTEEVANVVRYAASKGHKTIAALYPKTPYGAAVEQALVRSASAYGASVAASQRYAREALAITEPVKNLAASVTQGGIEAVLIPEGGDLLRTLGTVLSQNGVTAQSVKVLGTGLWDDKVTPTTPIAQGGWYAGVAPELIAKFDGRYDSNYGDKPPRLASLAYDATSLAIRLGKGGKFTAQAIAASDGFQGANGPFRFRQNGLIERGLAILQMTPAGPKVVSPAPTRFGEGS